MPIGTKVEIITENDRFNGLIGTLGAKTTDGLPAHKVCYDSGGFDCYMDYEIVPVQNIITIDNLEYESLCKIFEHDYLYETDRIIVKQKKFSFNEIKMAYVKHCNNLAEWANGTFVIGEENDIKIEYRYKIIGLLGRMIDDVETGGMNAIGETIVWEQWWIDGLRNHCTKNCKTGNKRYFNSEARIETIFI